MWITDLHSPRFILEPFINNLFTFVLIGLTSTNVGLFRRLVPEDPRDKRMTVVLYKGL